jgi:hypothetical protein
MSGKTSTYDTLQWVRSLIERGIRTYTYQELPDDLRINNLHRKAISKGYVKEIDKTKVRGVTQYKWTIASHINNISHTTSKRYA